MPHNEPPKDAQVPQKKLHVPHKEVPEPHKEVPEPHKEVPEPHKEVPEPHKAANVFLEEHTCLQISSVYLGGFKTSVYPYG